MAMNRRFDVIDAHAGLAAQLAEAADCLQGVRIDFVDRSVDASSLAKWAESIAGSKPALNTRALREAVERPVDRRDFVLWLDDLCRLAPRLGSVADLTLPPGRARNAGILLHPREVFGDEEVVYGDGRLALDRPLDYRTLTPPSDHSPVHPNWAARYLEPESDAGKLAALAERNPAFARRMSSLVEQLREAGATVRIESAVRSRHRGYLLFGSYWLSRAPNEETIARRIRRLNRYNRVWGLDVPIRWDHPDGPSASVEAARQLADTYGVVYATVRGARRSHHYDGNAIDVTALALPRRLRLVGTDGVEATFDLSEPDHPRDLSLSPALIDWVEQHFTIRKLRRDYPHWSDPTRGGTSVAR
jgi:hypothetical protein